MTLMILIWFYEKTFWKHDFYFQQSVSELLLLTHQSSVNIEKWHFVWFGAPHSVWMQHHRTYKSQLSNNSQVIMSQQCYAFKTCMLH